MREKKARLCIERAPLAGRLTRAGGIARLSESSRESRVEIRREGSPLSWYAKRETEGTKWDCVMVLCIIFQLQIYFRYPMKEGAFASG